MKITFENLKTESPREIVEQVCYKAVLEIRKALDNDSLEDFECIELIVELLEKSA